MGLNWTFQWKYNAFLDLNLLIIIILEICSRKICGWIEAI